MTGPDRLWVLLAKKKAGEASGEELSELHDLLCGNSAAGYTNEVIDKIWGAPLKKVPDFKVPEGLWRRIYSGIMARQKPIQMFAALRRPLAAASIGLILAASLIALYVHRDVADGPLTARGNLNQVATQPGSKSKLELPDGTLVWLNGDSKLTYPNGSFGKTNREVVLTGEAFFDVVKNEKIPFIIHTGRVDITVKGTAFNVKAYPKEKTVETALVRGLVEITTADDPERKILLKPNEKITIPVPEAAPIDNPTDTTNNPSLYTISKLNTTFEEPAEIAWMKSNLVFDNEPLLTLAPKMESWYNVRIRIGDETLKSKRFSGVIEKETLEETLNAMRLSYPFRYDLRGNELWIGTK